jgi:hypothetical protein
MKSDESEAQALFCELQAAKAPDRNVGEQFRVLARQWRELAQSAVLVEATRLRAESIV